MLAILLLASGAANACLFATKTPPEGWYQWSAALFAGDVTAVERTARAGRHHYRAGGRDSKGPDAPDATLTVHISSRHWTTCKVEVPAPGARVLVAMNANSDAMLVPLSGSFARS